MTAHPRGARDTLAVSGFVHECTAVVLLAETRTVAGPVDVELQHWWEHGLEVLAADPDCRPLGDRDAPGARALARGPRP